MQYNESVYNGDSYNLTNYNVNLVEIIISTDADVLKMLSMLRVDSQGTADTIGGSATLQAFLETVTIYQRAHTPFAYNNGMYNQFMYNARADEDEILLAATKALEDNIISVDTLGDFLTDKLLSETVPNVDTLVFSGDFLFQDFLFLSEFHRIEITNKALDDTLRLADWLAIERNPVNNEWFN